MRLLHCPPVGYIMTGVWLGQQANQHHKINADLYLPTLTLGVAIDIVAGQIGSRQTNAHIHAAWGHRCSDQRVM